MEVLVRLIAATAAVFGLVVAGVAVAATLQWSVYSNVTDAHLGRGVGLVGDLTGDHIEEFMVGSVGVHNWTGRVYVYDGSTRGLLTTIDGEAAGYRLGGRMTSAGDFNGDGVNDAAVAAVKWGPNQEGRIYVFSGPIPGYGSVLFSATGNAGDALGDELHGPLDFNRDGFGDIIVGAPYNDEGATNGGKIQVLGGPDGRVLFSKIGTVAERQLGISANHGNFDGDGIPDIVAGTFYASGIGKVFVYSGASGNLLWTKSGEGNRDRYGVVVSSVGDFNGDGLDDFVVGAPGAGKMYVYAGGSGALLYTKGEATEKLAPMGDVNGDGFADFASGVPSYRSGGKRLGKITVYGGPDLRVLSTITGPADGDLGFYFAGGADLTGDGIADLLAGAPGYLKKGAAFLFALP
jgi:hypothetical protein